MKAFLFLIFAASSALGAVTPAPQQGRGDEVQLGVKAVIPSTPQKPTGLSTDEVSLLNEKADDESTLELSADDERELQLDIE